jgi:hypothetical protein
MIVGYKRFDNKTLQGYYHHYHCDTGITDVKPFRYAVGETCVLPESSALNETGKSGFHFSEVPSYPKGKGNVYALVTALGKVDFDCTGETLITDKMKIEQLLTEDEMTARCCNVHMKSTITGNEYHFDENGLLHSTDDQPAKVLANGGQEWYQHGQLHRDRDLPAKVWQHRKQWFQNGLPHRDNDMPAIDSDVEICQFWYQHGLLHRDNDLPAIRTLDNECWYQHGQKQHQIDCCMRS